MFGRSNLPVVLLLLLFFVLAVGAVSQKSATFDELQHLTAGYSYWLHNDYRLNPENGVLPQRIAALPLLLARQKFPALNQPAWKSSNVLEIGYQMFYESGNDADLMLLSARSVIALLGVALGYLIFRWSSELFGRQGGLFSLALFAFSPTILANAPLVTSDLSVTLFLTSSTYAFWRLLQNQTWLNALLSALSVAGLFVSKFSAPIVIPVFAFLLIAFYALGPRINRSFNHYRAAAILILHIGVASSVIWICYGFRYSAFSPAMQSESAHFFERWENFGTVRFNGAIENAKQNHLLPEAYLYGFSTVLKHGQSRRAFLNGHYSLHGWWYFFPYSFLVKTPAPFLLILLMGIFAGIMKWKYLRGRGIKEDLYDIAPLLVLLIVYGAFALSSSLNIGHRHILPLYPPLLILAGGTASLWNHPNQVMRISLWAMLVWLVAETALMYPNFLTYFNQIAGGPRNGYLHMVDSSLDWGQDLPELKKQLLKSNANMPVYLSYFGVGSPHYYSIDAHMLPSYIDFRPDPAPEKSWNPGLYCISATMLQSVYSYVPGHWSVPYERAYQRLLKQQASVDSDFYLRQLRFGRLCAYLRHRQPDEFAGYSILIFHLTAQDLQLALAGPPAELVPEIDMR